MVARGIQELKNKQQIEVDDKIQQYLDRFYEGRIGIRLLIGQHISLSKGKRENYVGIICTKTNIRQICLDAIQNAQIICERRYGIFEAPKVTLICPNDLEFMYIPSHLHHMLFELLKNSLRAVQERDSKLLTKVIVSEGVEDICIKISDEGGGIKRSGIKNVWTYLYTTASPEDEFPMAGFGYGLPLSRVYARYFGGDLKLISMENYGTDVYLHLNRLSNHRQI